MFLSSHILSEVEALCDRIGILRSGRLVDEGTLADLRHLGTQTVEATFEGAPRSSLRSRAFTRCEWGATRCGSRCRTGRPAGRGPRSAPVVALESREPSLEEIFLHHYAVYDGGDGGWPGRRTPTATRTSERAADPRRHAGRCSDGRSRTDASARSPSPTSLPSTPTSSRRVPDHLPDGAERTGLRAQLRRQRRAAAVLRAAARPADGQRLHLLASWGDAHDRRASGGCSPPSARCEPRRTQDEPSSCLPARCPAAR